MRQFAPVLLLLLAIACSLAAVHPLDEENDDLDVITSDDTVDNEESENEDTGNLGGVSSSSSSLQTAINKALATLFQESIGNWTNTLKGVYSSENFNGSIPLKQCDVAHLHRIYAHRNNTFSNYFGARESLMNDRIYNLLGGDTSLDHHAVSTLYVAVKNQLPPVTIMTHTDDGVYNCKNLTEVAQLEKTQPINTTIGAYYHPCSQGEMNQLAWEWQAVSDYCSDDWTLYATDHCSLQEFLATPCQYSLPCAYTAALRFANQSMTDRLASQTAGDPADAATEQIIALSCADATIETFNFYYSYHYFDCMCPTDVLTGSNLTSAIELGGGGSPGCQAASDSCTGCSNSGSCQINTASYC